MMQLLSFMLVALNLPFFQVADATLVSDLRGLGLSPGTQIQSPSNVTERWSSYHAPSYKILVTPATDHDVAAIV